MHIERVEDDVALDALRNDWNRLAGDVPFRRFEWLATWWRHYRQPGWQLFVVTARDEREELVGILPLYWSQSLSSGRTLRFLGTGEVCSDYLTLLAADGVQANVARDIGDWLGDNADQKWDSLELVGLEAGDLFVGVLAERLRARGYNVHSRAGENCWRLKLPSTWSDYLNSLSKSRRERVRKLVRRSFDSGRAVTGVLDRHDEFDRYFDRLVELHQKRRISLGEPGSFASAKFTAFHRDVMEQLLSVGLLRLSWTDLDGSPAAIEYAIKGGDTVYFYQGGFEPRLAKEQPGWLSTIGSLRFAIDQGFRYFDFLRGDEAYKSSWGAKARTATEVRIVAPRLAARIRFVAWSTRKLLGRWKRSLKKHMNGTITRKNTIQRGNRPVT